MAGMQIPEDLLNHPELTMATVQGIINLRRRAVVLAARLERLPAKKAALEAEIKDLDEQSRAMLKAATSEDSE